MAKSSSDEYGITNGPSSNVGFLLIRQPLMLRFFSFDISVLLCVMLDA